MSQQIPDVGYRYITAKDIEWFYAGMPGHPFSHLGEIVRFMKDVGAISTALGTPYWNVIYGLQVWRQLNTEANIFGMLPKATWPRSGWRVVTSWGAQPDNIVTGETGTIPGPFYPQVRVLRANPRVLATSFTVSEVLEELAARSADDVWGALSQVRVHYGIEFAKLVNQLLAKPAVGSSASDVPTIPEGAPVTIDQIASSWDEVTGVYGSTPPSQVVSNVNIYGVTRSTDSWANAYVLHNNGTPRALTDSLILQLITGTKERGANPTDEGRFLLTGLRTWAAITALYSTFVRFFPMQEARITVGEMGYKYVTDGSHVGLRIAVLYNIPVIVSADVYADGAGLQRIYLLDTSDFEGNGAPRLGFSVLRPTEYFETRMEHFPLLKQFAYIGVYRMIGNTVARFLPGQGKLRDLA